MAYSNTPAENSGAPIRRLAIAGINGFPGQQLIQWADQCLVKGEGFLAQEYDELVALDLQPPPEKLAKTYFFKVDLTQPAVDQKISDIFTEMNVKGLVHLAFQINPHHNSTYSHELHSIGTMYLLNACAKQRVEKILVQSTTHCYGAFPNNPNFLSEEHPLRGSSKASYIRDRVDVEQQMTRYEKNHPECTVTVLRPCSILGPNINNFATRYFSRKVCLTPLGYDPLVQLVHEKDVVRAFQLALEKDQAGAFNIVGDGVLPLITLLNLAGRIGLPVANFLLSPLIQAMWQANVAIVPPGFLDYLRYLWVADGSKARQDLGFVPEFSTRETMLAFAAKQRLRKIHLEK